MHRFQRPAPPNELIGKIVQQLRVRRPLPRLAEVVHSTNQPLPKMMLPDTVHHYARQQRIRGPCECLRQRRTSTALGVKRRIFFAQYPQKPARDFWSEAQV